MINEELRALSIKQPYASLMLHGKIETRSWYTDYRGMVLICASKTPFGLEDIEKISGNRQVDRILEKIPGYFNNAPLGEAIAVGRLIHCRPMMKSDEDACFVRWRDELWCWEFDDVRMIHPLERSVRIVGGW